MKVLLVNSMPMVRTELRQLLEAQPDITFVAEADSCEAGVALIAKLAPDVAVLDFQKSFSCGAEAVGSMLAVQPGLKIIALSMYADRRYLKECLNAGVRGYLLKDCASEELVDAVRTVASDRRYFSRGILPEAR